jgi:hypothetical protein
MGQPATNVNAAPSTGSDIQMMKSKKRPTTVATPQ